MVKSTAILGMILCFVLGVGLGAAIIYKTGIRPSQAPVKADPVATVHTTSNDCQEEIDAAQSNIQLQADKIRELDGKLVMAGSGEGTSDQEPVDQLKKDLADAQAENTKLREDIVDRETGQAGTATVLYEPGVSMTIPLFHGLVGVPLAGGNATPKWIIPARVVPEVAPRSPGYLYRYFDIQERTFEPQAFQPQIAQQFFHIPTCARYSGTLE